MGAVTFATVALGVYLWVIHSQKLAISQPAILLGFAAVLAQRTPLRFPKPLLWFGGFVIWAAIAALASDHQGQALQGAWEYLKLWVIFLVAVNAARTPRQLRGFMIIWLGVFALYPVRGTLFNLAAGISTGNRYAWNFIFSNPNDLATLTLPMLAMVMAILPHETSWTRRAAWLGAVTLPAIIVATQSRAGILALGVMVVLFIVNARRRRHSRTVPLRRRKSHGLAYAIVAVCAALAIGLAAPRGVWDRLKGLRNVTATENLQEVDVEGSAAQRFEIWKVSWAIAVEHPLLGVGPGIYKKAHANYAGRGRFDRTAAGERDTHSTYFNALAEGGLPGLALLLAMLLSAFTGLRRAIARTAQVSPDHASSLRVLGIGLIGFLFASIFATMEHLPFLYLYLAIISSMIAVGPSEAPGPATLRSISTPRR